MSTITSPDRFVYLTTEIIRESHKLMHLELESARDEIVPSWIKLKHVLYYSAFTMIVGLASVIVLSQMLTHFLAEISGLASWTCDAIVLLFLSSVAFCLLMFTKSYYRKLSLFPTKTIETLRENLKCLSNQI